MCVVSMIYQWGQQQVPVQTWDGTTWPQFKKLVEDAKKLDDILGVPNCEDPAKVAYGDVVEHFLAGLKDAS